MESEEASFELDREGLGWKIAEGEKTDLAMDVAPVLLRLRERVNGDGERRVECVSRSRVKGIRYTVIL